MRMIAATVALAIAGAGCSLRTGPDPERLPLDFFVQLAWDSGVAAEADYLEYRITVQASGEGTIHYTLGRRDPTEYVEAFDVTNPCLLGLYAAMHESGLFGEPASGPSSNDYGGFRMRALAEFETYVAPQDDPAMGAVYEEIIHLVPSHIWDELEERQE